MLSEKHIPAEPLYEDAALDCILLDPSLIEMAINVIKLKPEHFISSKRGVIYQAMIDVHNSGSVIELPVLQSVIDKIDNRIVAGYSGSAPSAMNARTYFVGIKRAAFNRNKLVGLAGKVAELAYGDQTEEEAIADIELWMRDLAQDQASHRTVPIKEHVQLAINRVDDVQKKGVPPGVRTGYTMLDKILGSLHGGRFYILGARPAMGKSSLALNIAVESAKKYKTKAAFFGLEMANEQTVDRMLSMESGIQTGDLTSGSPDIDWNELLNAANTLSSLNISLEYSPGMTVADVRTKSKQLLADQGLDLIIIDYLQLMTGSKKNNGNRQEEISEISRSLKNLAMELNIPIIALSQLSRSLESRTDKRPMLSDLRESGSLEQDADVVLFIYREDYYEEDTDRKNIADIIVAKNRHGAIGTVSLYFRKELTLFRNLEIQRTEFE